MPTTAKWGNDAFLWGNVKWGEGFAGQNSEPGAKPYSLFLAKSDDGTGSDLVTDLSQYATDASGSGSYHSHFTAGAGTVFNIDYPRSVVAVLDNITSSDNGFVFQVYGSAETDGEAFGLQIAAGILRADVNGASAGLLTIPNISATASKIVVGWATRLNPGTTGAGDARQSFLYAYNITNGTFDQLEFTHAAQGTGDHEVVFFARQTDGTGSFGKQVGRSIRVDEHFLTAVEMREDWIATSAKPTTSTTLERAPEIEIPQSTAVGNAGEFYGPELAHAAQVQNALVRRTSWPLVNHRYRTVDTWQSTTPAAKTEAIRYPPGETAWYFFRGWFHPALPVHPMADSIWCQIHLKTWPASGASVPLGLRVYSFNKRPGDFGGFALEPPEPTEFDYVEMTVDRDDSAGVGSFVQFTDLLPIKRGQGGIREGKTYLAIAFAIDPADLSSNDANERFQIAAFHAIQVKNADTAGGIPGPQAIKDP